MRIRKEFTFSAAHRLPNVPEGHKCGRVHGHTYRVVLTLDGPLDRKMGWLIDFGDIKNEFNRLADIWLDHRYLNDMPGMSNPTAELLCWWMFDALLPSLEFLSEVEVWETPTSAAMLDVVEYLRVREELEVADVG